MVPSLVLGRKNLHPRLLLLGCLILITGCSDNLDSQCADFYTEVTVALDEILAADSEEDRVRLVEGMSAFSDDLKTLEEKVMEKINQKIVTGEIPSDLAPPGTKMKPKLIFDDLTQRKVVALNGFLSRRWEIKVESSILDDMVGLVIGCNNTLR